MSSYTMKYEFHAAYDENGFGALENHKSSSANETKKSN